MREPDPVLTVHLFPEERERLLDLLSGLSDEEWSKPTACAGWSVKDIALHILDDDIGLLSRKRDGHVIGTEEAGDWDGLVAFLNRWNELWVEAARRISRPLLLDLLRSTGEGIYRYWSTLDLHAVGGPVSWAGPEPAPVWLDVAREYTERWLHQQQIRDAVEKPGLKDRRFFAPVLATFVRALPRTYRDVDAPDGTHVLLVIEGEAGGEWSVVRQDERWLLRTGLGGTARSQVRIGQEAAWRLFTNGLSKKRALEEARLEGDRSLGLVMLDAVAIIA